MPLTPVDLVVFSVAGPCRNPYLLGPRKLLSRGDQRREPTIPIQKGSPSRPLSKATKREELFLAVKAKPRVTGKFLPKVLARNANRADVFKKFLPYPGTLNRLFKPISARKLVASGCKVLRPADPPNELELCR